jgi:hypothetical protein
MCKNEHAWVVFVDVCSVTDYAHFSFQQECFDPIVAKTGRDLIPVMVYGYVVPFFCLYILVLTILYLLLHSDCMR